MNALNAIFIGVKDGKETELLEVYENALREILEAGIPRDTLRSALKRREFNVRESDFGTFPAGMVYMRSCIEYAMLGEDPALSLKYEGTLDFLYEKLDTDYYEEIIKEIIDSPRATLILHPDTQFTEKKEEELAERLDKIAEAMSEEEKAALISETEKFRKWQSTPNTQEELATLPILSIDDLKTEPRKIPGEVLKKDCATVVLHPLHTGGIAYANLFFDASDADEEEIHYLRLFTDLMFEWSTENMDSTEFRNKTKQHLGAFYLTTYTAKNGMESKLYLQLHASCLDSEKANAISVITEYLYSTLYNDPAVLKKNLKQLYTYSLESMSARGDAFAGMRSAARHSTFEAISEHLFGYEYHVFIKELAQRVEEKADDILARLDAVSKKYFVRERLTLGLTETNGEEYATALVNAIRCGGTPAGKTPVKTLEKVNEGIAVPTTVSFAATGANLDEIGEGIFNGSFPILQSIASLELLWNEIRLKNGAYDTGFAIKPTGAIGCYSYRDPSPAASIAYFRRITEETAAFLDTSPDLLKYIIGTFGASDTVSTPRSDGTLATKRYLAGRVHEDFLKRRRECLETTLDELYRINGIVKQALENSTFTVVGPRDELEKIDGIARILDI